MESKQHATWQLQQAKQQFSEVVRKAHEEGPQQVTKNGEESVWIISASHYHYLSKRKKSKKSLVDFFQTSPCRDIDLPIERSKDLPRDVTL